MLKAILLGNKIRTKKKLLDDLKAKDEDFEKRETGYMDEVRDTLECRANKVIREDFLKSQAER